MALPALIAHASTTAQSARYPRRSFRLSMNVEPASRGRTAGLPRSGDRGRLREAAPAVQSAQGRHPVPREVRLEAIAVPPGRRPSHVAVGAHQAGRVLLVARARSRLAPRERVEGNAVAFASPRYRVRGLAMHV